MVAATAGAAQRIVVLGDGGFSKHEQMGQPVCPSMRVPYEYASKADLANKLCPSNFDHPNPGSTGVLVCNSVRVDHSTAKLDMPSSSGLPVVPHPGRESPARVGEIAPIIEGHSAPFLR